jgi:Putative ATPase subunit of terminase (gpP-like)
MKKLMPHQLRAAELFLQGLSTKEVAKRVGRSIESVQNWAADPLFKNYLEELQRDCIDATLSKAVALTPRALKTLEEIMTDKKTKAGDRIRASNAIIQHGLNARQVQEMKSEIEKLKTILRVKHVPSISYDATGVEGGPGGAHSHQNGFAGSETTEGGQGQRNGAGTDATRSVASVDSSEHLETDLDELQPSEW